MVNQDGLTDYSDSINTLRNQCLDAGMSEDEFRKLYFESLQSLEKPTQPSPRLNLYKTKYVVLLIVLLTASYSIYNSKAIYSSIVCHLQEYIYPGLRLLRKISIPFISLFPSLTDLYHESCLLQNPFFTVADMDCWPCSTVNNVRAVSNPTNDEQQLVAPFIYKTDQNIIHLELLQEIYMRNKNVFDKETMEISVNNKDYVSINKMLFKNSIQENNLYIWKFNSVQVAKLLRPFIARPIIVPKFGQSTERFIIVDSSQKAFEIPDTECSYSFLISLHSTRTITLSPAEECKHQCKSLKVELEEGYLLWYNWWYWRPTVQPSTGNATFIAHVGSYC